MKTYVTETKECQKLDKVFCNKCGQNADHHANKDWASMEVSWGYFSSKDLEHHKWDICEDCYDEFVSAFKHPPARHEYSISNGQILGLLDDIE